MWNLVFLFTGLIFDIVLLGTFFLKKTIKTRENTIFKYISICNALGFVIEIALQLSVINIGPNSFFSFLLAKLYLAEIITWFGVFSIYTFTICTDKKNKNKYHKKIKIIDIGNIVFLLFGIVLSVALPISIYYDNNIMYSYGTALNALKLFIVVYMLVWIILLCTNVKKLKQKKFIPVFTVIIMLILNVILNSIDPSVLVTTMVGAIISYTMYFTIENPDVKIVNELYKNKNIMEQTYIDKSNFLFEMTQEVRDPMFNIKNICNDLKDSNSIDEYKKGIDKILKYTKQIDYMVNDVLNVNSLEANQIKFIDNTYNANLIFEEIVNQTKKAINKDVTFTTNVENDLPLLYGDSIKLKQIVTSLLLDSARRTKNGFIDFKVNTIKRFDALRLIIQIKDSSKGLPIDVINNILNTTASLDQKDIELLDKNEINLDLCQKVIKLMGGNLLIKSSQDKVTEMILSLDQKIYKEEDESFDFEKYIKEDKKIVIVNQNKKENEKIKKVLDDFDKKSIVYLNGVNIIDDIKAGKSYDYIIVGNDMEPKNGYTILKELKAISGFNIPVAIIVQNEDLKKAFLSDGFSNVIIADSLEKDLTEILNNNK